MKVLVLTLLFLVALPAYAAESWFSDTVYRAEVLTVDSTGERSVPATRLKTSFQALSVKIIEGERSGEVIEVENDTPLTLEAGDVFYLHSIPATDGSSELWAVGEPDRVGVLGWLTLMFVVITVIVAGMAGFRSLIALAGSFLIIVYGLLPALSAGAPPAITCTVLAFVVLAFSMFVTHGFAKETWIALAGSTVALVIAAFIAHVSVVLANLTGFVSDETVYLNFQSDGTLNLTGLLLGGILIGIVGVLNDISVSQVHTVAELHSANTSLTRRQIFMKAMKVGREHLGAVVNTLPLAYAGASLPLLLLFSNTEASLGYVLSREVFAAEIIRTLGGGIGLMLSGAVATVLAVVIIVARTRHDKIVRNHY